MITQYGAKSYDCKDFHLKINFKSILQIMVIYWVIKEEYHVNFIYKALEKWQKQITINTVHIIMYTMKTTFKKPQL